MDQPDPVSFKSIPMLINSLDASMQRDCKKLLVGPKRFDQVRFEGVAPEYQEQVREVIDSLFSDKPKGIFLTGDVGTGKTSILRIIWKYVISGLTIEYWRSLRKQVKMYEPNMDHGLAGAIGWQYNFLTNWELVRDLRNLTSDENRGFADDHVKTQFLFIDDLGRGFEDKSGWNLALQDEFFDARWQECLPTFISTNKTPDELRGWEGWSRIVDRLADPSWMVMLAIGDGSRRLG